MCSVISPEKISTWLPLWHKGECNYANSIFSGYDHGYFNHIDDTIFNKKCNVDFEPVMGLQGVDQNKIDYVSPLISKNKNERLDNIENMVIHYGGESKENSPILSDEELAIKRYRQSLFMYIPIVLLIVIGVMFIFIPGAFIGLNIAFALTIPVLIVMINLAQQVRLYSASEKLRGKARLVQISGWILFASLFVLALLGVFIALNIGTLSIF